MKSSPSIWHLLLHIVKSTVKISSIFVAFLENMNFTSRILEINQYILFFCCFLKNNYVEFQTVVDHDGLRGQIWHSYTMFYDSNTIAYIVLHTVVCIIV